LIASKFLQGKEKRVLHSLGLGNRTACRLGKQLARGAVLRGLLLCLLGSVAAPSSAFLYFLHSSSVVAKAENQFFSRAPMLSLPSFPFYLPIPVP